MSDIRVACAQCEGRGRLLKEGASMTTPCGRCGGTGFVKMPDPQPELTHLRAQQTVLVDALACCDRQLTHYNNNLEYRQTGRDPKNNGYAFAEIPDWSIKQMLEVVHEALTTLDVPDPKEQL